MARFINAFFEVLEAIFASDKKSHVGKKVGSAMAKKSFKKLKRVW